MAAKPTSSAEAPADPVAIIDAVRHRLVRKLSQCEVGCPEHGRLGVAVMNCVGCQRQAVLTIAIAIVDDPATYLGIGGARTKDLATAPPKHSEYTVNGVIERCTDLDRLRALAIQLREALIGQHELIGHLINDYCEACGRAAELCDPTQACRMYQGRQKQYLDAINATRDWS